MQVKWKKLIVKITTWLFVEILLNFLGLDTLADYSEFIFTKHLVNSEQSNEMVEDLAMTKPINKNSNKQRSPKSNVVQFVEKSQSDRSQSTDHRSKGFGEKFKFFSGEQLHRIRVICRMAGTVTLSVLPWAGLCTGYGLIVSLLYNWGLLDFITASKPIYDGILGLNLALGLLLAFKINIAHDRFGEGHKLWGSIVNNIRNLTKGIWIYIEGEGIQDQREKEMSMRLVAAFSTSMKLHLRREQLNFEIESLVSPPQYQQLQKSNQVPLELALLIGDYLQRCYERKKLSVFQLTDLQNSLKEMANVVSDCEQLLKAPVPVVYTIALKTLLITYFLILPLLLVAGLGWVTGLVLGFISLIYLSIDQIGAEIEEPFGHSPNDLPLDFICDTIQGNVEDLIRHVPNSSKIMTLHNSTRRAA